MGANDTFVYGVYNSDDNNQYMVKLTAADAQAGGFQVSSDPKAYPAYPYNTKDIRHVTSYEPNTGRFGRLKIARADLALFVSGGTYNNTNTGRTYVVMGAFGERRPLSHLGGG